MIYLDHNATTPVLPEVFEAMKPYFCEDWGNPSSTYRFGAKIKSVVENARDEVATLCGANAREIVFTSCATESNNAAIHAALKSNPKKRHVITSVVEHSSVLNYCAALEKDGVRVTYLPTDRDGLLQISDLKAAISADTAVVSLMWANNETGVIFPVDRIAEICKASAVLFHCDAVQAVGKLPVDLKKLPIDYLSITGHKLNAPKGIGALYVRRKSPFFPLMYGGHQERGMRGGTENVPLIVGFGKAAAIAQKHLTAFPQKVGPLRDALENGILKNIPDTELNGHPNQRLANTSNITFHGIDSEALLLLLDKEGICASSGSACLADSDEPSHVVKAMKPDSAASRQMIRFSLGTNISSRQISEAVSQIEKTVRMLRP